MRLSLTFPGDNELALAEFVDGHWHVKSDVAFALGTWLAKHAADGNCDALELELIEEETE